MNSFFRFFWDLLSSRGLKSFIRVIWVTLNNAYCIPAYFFYMFTLRYL